MTVSAHDVSDELRRRLPGVGVVKLHKLLYYAQGWSLAWNGEPLFDEAIEAWTNGPAVASLWADEKHGRPRPTPRTLRGDQLAVVEYVVDRYGRWSGKDLIRQTHIEDPWRGVAETENPSASRDPELTHEALRSWFEMDEEHQDYAKRADALRARTDVFSFDPPELTPDARAAVERALNGEKVRHRRPA